MATNWEAFLDQEPSSWDSFLDEETPDYGKFLDSESSWGDFQASQMVPGFFETSARRFGERGFELAGNFVKTLQQVAEPIANKMEESAPLGGFVFEGYLPRYVPPSEFGRVKAETPNAFHIAAEKLKQVDFNAVPKHTWEEVKRKFTSDEEGVGSAIGEVFKYAGEQGIASIPDMVNVTLNLPSYVLARSGEIGEERARNKGKEKSDLTDTLEAAPFALGSAILERVGALGIVTAGKETAEQVGKGALKTIIKEGLKAGGKEAGTEFAQEGLLEYVGEKYGTNAAMRFAEGLERGFAGAVAGGLYGGPTGAVGAGVRTALSPEQEIANTIENITSAESADQAIESALNTIEPNLPPETSPTPQTIDLGANLTLEPIPTPSPPDLRVIDPETGQARLANPLDQALAEEMRLEEQLRQTRAAREAAFAKAEAETQSRKEAELRAIQADSQVPAAEYDAEVARREGLTEPQPTAMGVALGKAMEEKAAKDKIVNARRAAEEVRRQRLPENFQDYRLAREPFRKGLQQMASELVEGGDITITGEQFSEFNQEVPVNKETPVRRTPSMNPAWFKSMTQDPDRQVSVAQAKNAVRKALNGESLGLRESRVVASMLEEISGERTSEEVLAGVRRELEQARILRQQGLSFSNQPPGFNDVEIAGEIFEEREYNPDWDGEARALFELAAEAEQIDAEGVDDALESIDDSTAARKLWGIILRNKADEQAKTGQEEVAEKQAEQPQAEEAEQIRNVSHGEFKVDSRDILQPPELTGNIRRYTAKPSDLLFREEEQGRISQTKELFPEGEGYPPIVGIRTEDGVEILDGHNRAAVAEERGESIPVVEIPLSSYQYLRDNGYDDIEIAYTALDIAGETQAASALNNQFPGAGVAKKGGAAAAELYKETITQPAEELTAGATTPPATAPAIEQTTEKQEVSPTTESVPAVTPAADPAGVWQHSRFEAATANVTKTDEGYRVEWSEDDVDEFRGKNAEQKLQKAMEREGFVKSEQQPEIEEPTEKQREIEETDKAVAKHLEKKGRPQFSIETSDIFYSKLVRSVADFNQPKAAPQQWLAAMKKNGVKQEEMDWMGVDEFMEGKQSVIKEELAQFVAENQVEVREVEKGQREGSIVWDGNELMLDGEAVAVIQKKGEMWNVYDAYVGFVDEGLVANSETREGAKHAAVMFARQGNENFAESENNTKFSNYQLPGGENYRELLLTLPAKELTFKQWNENRKSWGKEPGTIQEYEENIKGTIDAGAATFKGGHFDEPNILAHIRFNERTDSEGKRVLFIEEIQSDWHQEGRRRGYEKKRPLFEDVRNEYAELSNKINLAIDPIIREETGSRKEAERLALDRNLVSQEELGRMAELNAIKYGEKSGVPDAPFKKTWPLLAMKRMIRYAAENGYDKIAWTTGEQQAERYDLSKQIKMASITKNNDGTMTLYLEGLDGDHAFVNQGGFNQYGQKTIHDASELEDTIGKEPAKKLLDGVEKLEKNKFFDIRGEDLKVGGEGMKSFYDKMLPNIVNKYVKKWGVKVGETGIKTGETTMYSMAPDADRFSSRQENEISKTHSLDITPAMRESAMQGQPLFSKQTGTKKTSFTKAQAEAAISRSKDAVSDLTGLEVKVIGSEEVPQNIRDEAYRTENGVTYFPKAYRLGDTVYLIHDHLDNARDANVQFAHEVKGHFGVERTVGPEGWSQIEQGFDQMQAIQDRRKVKDKQFEKIMAEVNRRYDGADKSTRVKEFIAIAAELQAKEETVSNQGIVGRFMQRVREIFGAAIRKLFRRPFSMKDIDLILSRSEAYIRTGKKGIFDRPKPESFMEGELAPQFMIQAYHGTPHKVDKFSIKHIGTGEGAQAFGHGLYFAESEGVAKNYRAAGIDYDPYIQVGDRKIGLAFDNAISKNEKNAVLELIDANGDFDKARGRVQNSYYKPSPIIKEIDLLESKGAKYGEKPRGNLYTVDIDVNPEDLLDWDKPLSEQPEKVKKFIERNKDSLLSDINHGYPLKDESLLWEKTGADLYRAVAINKIYVQKTPSGNIPLKAKNLKSAIKEAGGNKDNVLLVKNPGFEYGSELLKQAGIPGIQFLDQGSRAEGEGTRNFVIFDDSKIKITAENGQLVAGEEKQHAIEQIREEMEQGPDTQSSKEVGGGTPPSEGQIVPIIQTADGRIFYGEVGDTHLGVIKRFKDQIGDTKGSEATFATSDGKPMTREEAIGFADKLGVKTDPRGKLDAVKLQEKAQFSIETDREPPYVKRLREKQEGLKAPKTPSTRSDFVRFESEETERRYREATKGIADQRTIAERFSDFIERTWHGFTRRHIDLPNKARFALANEALRQYEAAPQYAKEEAIRQLKNITNGMNRLQYDLFTRKVILDDLAYEVELGHDLPFGYTPESLARDKQRVDAAVEGNQMLKERVKYRKDMQDIVRDELIAAGILDKDQAKNPAYFRHQVLSYARARQMAQGSGNLKQPKPGYAKKRMGSMEDINANYLEAEFEFLHRAMIDLKAVETIKKIAKDYDISGELKELDGKNWRDKLPDGYKLWQPDKGNLFYTGLTVPERMVNQLIDRLATADMFDGQVGVPEIQEVIDSIRKVVMMGGKKYEMAIPEEIADTLDKMRPDTDEGFVNHALAKPLKLWKQWVLINPRRVLKYNLNNISGDADAVIAGNPRALKKMPEAIRELYQVMKGAEPSQRYREAVERGVFDAGLTVQEIPDINLLDPFQDIIEKPTAKQPLKFAASKAYSVWKVLRDYTRFRENWLRYAAYLDYVERLESGESMESVGYGASNPEMVDEILADNTQDGAALLARDLVGDYGDVSAYGQGIRKKIIPFYSWLEVNTRRYLRLIDNAYSQGVGKGLKTTGIVGAAMGTRTTAWLGVRMAIVYGLVQLWNHLFFDDEEEKLSATDRVRLHINLGEDSNGQIRTIRFQGALSDFLQWFGAEDAVAAMLEIEKGRASWEDVAKAVAKGPVNKVVSGITPVIKTPTELFSGLSFYPDAFNPRAIKDKKRDVARLFSLENEYDWITGRPTRGYARSLEGAVTYKVDAGEAAYNKIRGLGFEFNRRVLGTEGQSTYTSPRSKALYEWRLAKRFKDEKAEKKALKKLVELDMSLKDIVTSVRRAHPLGPVAKKRRKAFMETLTPREKQAMEEAEKWYKETYNLSEIAASYKRFRREGK